MSKSVFDQPTLEQMRGFVRGDPIVKDEVIRLLLPQLTRWAIKEYSGLPEDEVISLLNQVLAETCKNHARYDPQRGTLFTTYIINLYRLRIADLFKKNKKDEALQSLENDVQEFQSQSVYNIIEESAETVITRDIFFSTFANSLSPVEKDFLDLMRKGEISSQTFQKVLHKHSVSTPHPDNEVKNMKERLKRKAKEFAREIGYKFKDMVD